MAQLQTKFIANNAVTNAKLAQMATLTIKGNNTGSTANALDLTVAQVNAILPVFTSSLNGLAPSSGGGTTNFLRADGTWAAPSGSGGTVTSVSVVSANGLAGTVATATSTPAITLSTTVTGILQGNGTAISAASTTGSGSVVLATSPTLVTPALGTPSALVGTNITGTAAGLTAGTVTTNANLTGDVTSVGNATTLVATTNATITTLSALSLPYSQITGAPTALTPISQNITLVSGDITNQYVDLAHAISGASASVNSAELSVVGGPVQQKTVDYTVSLTGGAGGVTRISFAGDLASGGNAALVSGDILMVYYSY